MSVIVLLLLASLGVAVLFLLAFIFAVRSGQYDDPVTPAMRILIEDEKPTRAVSTPGSKTKEILP
jgi:cbb3-type cytochrome oxidase maturation protein